jgi:hypothetical protein
MASQVTGFDPFIFLSVGVHKGLEYQSEVQGADELRGRIAALLMLQNTCREAGYCPDICRVIEGAHMEIQGGS